MKSKTNLTLIEGQFSIEEAREVLMNIFTDKVNFHKLKNLSSIERMGYEDPVAEKRIPELKKEIERLQVILDEAQKHNFNLSIHSEISIVLTEKEISFSNQEISQ